MSKKILVLGATGAMGQYLVPLLAEKGFEIDAVALDEPKFPFPNVHGITTGNARDLTFLHQLLQKHYDGIVDFMVYCLGEVETRLMAIPPMTDHYIYLSSYRIYDNKEIPIRETSPRLKDTADDLLLRHSNDYSVYKAHGEDILHLHPRKNWTIVRPAITYSLMRYQLVTLEAPETVGRAFAGKSTIVPIQAKDKQATMSWAGDVARMIAGLLFNEQALGETYTVSTSEHHTWGEIAEYYQQICGLKSIWVDKSDFRDLMFPAAFNNVPPYWQLEVDRLFDRVIDNSKILAATGMRQPDLKPLYDGLEMEIARCPRDHRWNMNPRFDAYLTQHGLR